MKKVKLFLGMLVLILASTAFASAQSKEGNFIAAFYYATDLSNDTGIIVVHNGGKPEIINNASLIKFMEEMKSKKWAIIQSNRAPSRTGDYECVYMLFEKKK